MGKDCFAYNVTKCDILIELNCVNCKFYKTIQQKEADEVNAIKILKKKGFPEISLAEMPGYKRYLLEVQR